MMVAGYLTGRFGCPCAGCSCGGLCDQPVSLVCAWNSPVRGDLREPGLVGGDCIAPHVFGHPNRSCGSEGRGVIKEGESTFMASIWTIEISKIEPNCRCVYDSETIDVIAKSIRAEGQREPITIWFAGTYFRILDGEKRWRACKKIGIRHMKAIIVEDT